jgi:membrane protein implicated in regulation of membrane protease activity
VYLHGELWQAETTAGDIAPGREVVVQGFDGLTLQVAPVHTHSTEGVTT